MSDIEREIRRQRWHATQRMLAAMVAVQEARRLHRIELECEDGPARVVRVGATRWRVWIDGDGTEHAICLGRIIS